MDSARLWTLECKPSADVISRELQIPQVCYGVVRDWAVELIQKKCGLILPRERCQSVMRGATFRFDCVFKCFWLVSYASL